jgi:hypothetical protein
MNCARWISTLVLPLVATSALCAEKDSVRHQNQLLEAELRLAETPQIYFLFDLKDKKVYVKARGRALRELEVKGIRFWGKASVVRTEPLLEKSTLFPPKRSLIEPRSSESGEEVRVETLELKDMPATYTLVMQDQMWIYIRPEPTNVLEWLWSAQYPIRWYLSRPILTVWHALWKRGSFTSIDIVLHKDDARTLYWSFLEGMHAVVFSPGGAL